MRKTKLTRSLLAACSIVALSVALSGCLHDGDDDEPTTAAEETPMPDPDPEPMDPEPDPDPDPDPEPMDPEPDPDPEPMDPDPDPEPMEPDPEPEPEPTPTGTIDGIPQTTGFLAALSGAVPEGETEKQHPMEAGTHWAPGGVLFQCADGDMDCIVHLTVTRGDDGNVDSVSATWEGGAVTASFIDPLGDMNAANSATIGAMMNVAFNATAIQGPPAVPAGITARPDNTQSPALPSGLGGLKDGMLGVSTGVMGAGAADDSMVSLMAMFDPNVTTDDTITNADNAETRTVMGVELDAMETAGALGLMGWNHRLLHVDWGDNTTPLRDGGFETIALIYSNIEMPGDVLFTDAAMTIADDIIRPWFTLDATNGDVDIDTTNAALATPTANIMIPVENPQVTDLSRQVQQGDQFTGSYFGAMGTLTCEAGPCRIARTETGLTPFTAATAAGTWSFVPAEGAVVELPDQDWLAFGFWLTAPDDIMNGDHRAGVFYDGMDTYANDGATLTGEATYSGAATGYYVDGAENGVFTATANLTADFGAAGTAAMLSGSINDFRNSAGVYLGSDTVADPNDPAAGGEGDWTVTLNSTAINGDGRIAPATPGTIRGSGDGVTWDSGEWTAQFYGNGDRATPITAPSGVAGNFRALATLNGDAGFRGAAGAFGATLDEHTPAATQ